MFELNIPLIATSFVVIGWNQIHWTSLARIPRHRHADILARMSARKSVLVSAPWNASFFPASSPRDLSNLLATSPLHVANLLPTCRELPRVTLQRAQEVPRGNWSSGICRIRSYCTCQQPCGHVWHRISPLSLSLSRPCLLFSGRACMGRRPTRAPANTRFTATQLCSTRKSKCVSFHAVSGNQWCCVAV